MTDDMVDMFIFRAVQNDQLPHDLILESLGKASSTVRLACLSFLVEQENANPKKYAPIEGEPVLPKCSQAELKIVIQHIFDDSILSDEHSDHLIIQAVLNNQLPNFMMPKLIEKVEKEENRAVVLRHLFAVVKQRCVAAPSRMRFRTQPNYMTILVALDQLDSSDMRDMAIADMIQKGTVPKFMYPLLMEQVENENIEDALRTFIMTKGTSGSFNPAIIAFADGDIADYYAAQALLNNNTLPVGFMPFLSSKQRQTLQKEILVNHLSTRTSQKKGANPCGRMVNPRVLEGAFPLFYASSKNCNQQDLTDCCQELLDWMVKQPATQIPGAKPQAPTQHIHGGHLTKRKL